MSDEKNILRDQFDRPIPHEKEAADPNKYVIEATVRFSDFPPPPPHHENPKAKWYQTKEGWKFAIECALFVLGLIGAIIAFICGFIYYGQMDANRRQAKAAEDQLSIMQETLKTDERAWVGVEQLTEFYPGPRNTNDIKDYMFQVRIRNYGKTPAKRIMMTGNFQVDREKIPPRDNFKDINQSQETLFPSEELRMQIGPFYGTNNLIYVYGTVKYDDIFGQPHWSQFCHGCRFSNGESMSVDEIFHSSCDEADSRSNIH
jgi:hypothetical protein